MLRKLPRYRKGVSCIPEAITRLTLEKIDEAYSDNPPTMSRQREVRRLVEAAFDNLLEALQLVPDDNEMNIYKSEVDLGEFSISSISNEQVMIPAMSWSDTELGTHNFYVNSAKELRASSKSADGFLPDALLRGYPLSIRTRNELGAETELLSQGKSGSELVDLDCAERSTRHRNSMLPDQELG